MIKVAAVQFNHMAGDVAYNLARIKYFCQRAVVQEVQLIAFPEMCISGYWHVRNLPRNEIEELAELVPHGPTTQTLGQLAREHKLLIGAGLIEKTEDGRLFNTYVLCDSDGAIHSHR